MDTVHHRHAKRIDEGCACLPTNPIYGSIESVPGRLVIAMGSRWKITLILFGQHWTKPSSVLIEMIWIFIRSEGGAFLPNYYCGNEFRKLDKPGPPPPIILSFDRNVFRFRHECSTKPSGWWMAHSCCSSTKTDLKIWFIPISNPFTGITPKLVLCYSSLWNPYQRPVIRCHRI